MSYNQKAMLFLIFSITLLGNTTAQTTKVGFLQDTFRINAGSKETEEVILKIHVPVNISKKAWKIKIALKGNNFNGDESNKIKLPLKNEFKLDELKDSVFNYSVILPRNKKDDRNAVFSITADSAGTAAFFDGTDSNAVVLIKPFTPDSLSTNDNWEFWVFTGTNFDFFDGIKAEQFFFRANTLFKVSDHFYGQIAFYKNRFFTFDTTSMNSFSQQIPIIPPNDSIKYVLGTYTRNVRQTTDVVGVHLDAMFKLKNIQDVSSYFATAGLDISSRTIILENTFSNFDSVTITKPKPGPDSAIRFNPLPDKRFSYQKPVYNINVGLMWILNTEKINVKAHLTGGYSWYSEPLFRGPVRGGTMPYYNYHKVYAQLRLFGTYKPSGISLGFDMFSRRNEIPQFNFTLSKVFDLSNFLDALTPVSALSLK